MVLQVLHEAFSQIEDRHLHTHCQIEMVLFMLFYAEPDTKPKFAVSRR